MNTKNAALVVGLIAILAIATLARTQPQQLTFLGPVIASALSGEVATESRALRRDQDEFGNAH